MSMLTDSPKQFATLLVDLIRASQDGFAIFDQNDVLMFCNHEFAFRLGLRIVDAEGKTFAQIIRLSHESGKGIKIDNGDVDSFIEESSAKHSAVGFRCFTDQLSDESWIKISQLVTQEGYTFVYVTDISKLIQTELELRETLEQVKNIAATDPLTNIHNRRYFFDMASKELKRSSRHHSPMCLLALDIDNFKSINDTYGHLCGDEVLVAVASACAKQLRDYDIFARIGGEEFSILLPNTQLYEAQLFAERILATIRQLTIPYEDLDLTITLSIGIAKYDETCHTLESLMDRADQALYQAKDNGRNKLEVYMKD